MVPPPANPPARFPADKTFARLAFWLGDLSRLFPSGLVGVSNVSLPKLVVVVGGRLAIRLPPVDFGGCGNDAMETTRRGTGVLDLSIGTGSEGVEGRAPADCGTMERPLLPLRGVCGRSEAFRRLDTEERWVKV